MADFEVHIDLNGRTRQVGLARSNRVRGKETVLFEYAERWLDDPGRFSLQPALAMTRGAFVPPAGQSVFGSIGDSAPDTWGRRLMQRAERRSAEREGWGDCDLARYRQKNRCAACRNQPHGQRLRA
jgi:serine/threonine-protein kinase HipA